MLLLLLFAPLLLGCASVTKAAQAESQRQVLRKSGSIPRRLGMVKRDAALSWEASGQTGTAVEIGRSTLRRPSVRNAQFWKDLRALKPRDIGAVLNNIRSATLQGAALTSSSLDNYLLTEEVTKPVTKPKGSPCYVSTLLKDQNFSTILVPISTAPYTPPPAASCGTSWQLVVIRYSAHVTGRQFDRIYSVLLGNVPLLRGTTMEPRFNGTKWTIERDITHLSSYLKKGHKGTASIGNVVTDVYTGVFYVTTQILFYPGPAPPGLPDLVLPVSLPLPLLPRNIVRAQLELTVEHHADDEFYYMNVADQYWDSLSSDQQSVLAGSNFPGGSFKEVIITLDGRPAGNIFSYPVLYTGAYDPLMWVPFVGVGAFLLPQYAVDLTPFVGSLVNGLPHNLSYTVNKALPGGNWIVDGPLLLWLDPELKQTSGRLTSVWFSTLSLNETNKGLGTLDAELVTSAARTLVTRGFVVSSAGNLTTSVTTMNSLKNRVRLSREGLMNVVDFMVTSSVVTQTSKASKPASSTTVTASYPLSLVSDVSFFPDGAFKFYTSVDHAFNRNTSAQTRAIEKESNAIVSTNALANSQSVSGLNFNNALRVVSGTQSYSYKSTAGDCYTRLVESTASIPQNAVDIRVNQTSTMC